MPTPFSSISGNDAKDKIKPIAAFGENHKLLYEDDHWQQGKGFIGPMEAALSGGGTEADLRARIDVNNIVTAGVQKNFTSENVLKEVSKRKRNGIIGKHPQFAAEVIRPLDYEANPPEEPDEEEQTRIREQDAAMAEWWDTNGAHEVMKEFGLAVLAFTKSYLRVFIPAGRLGPDGQLLGVSNPADALENIFVEHVFSDRATVYKDPNTRYELGVVHFPKDDDDPNSRELVELCYLDPDSRGRSLVEGRLGRPLTVVRQVVIQAGQDSGPAQATTGAAGQGQAQVTKDLRGVLTLFEGATEFPFISEQMKQQQRALNTASTEMRIVNDDRGFPETVFLNAQPPATVVVGPNGQPEIRPLPNYVRSPGSVAAIEGKKIIKRGPSGEEVVDFADPDVKVIEAATVDNYVEEMKQRRIAILRESKQLFVELIDDATASGESRIQALFDYLTDITDYKAVIDRAGKWLLETVWALALDLSGQAGRDHDLKVVFDAKINIPYLPTALVTSIIEQVKAGVRSKETAMADFGIEDIDAEKSRVVEEAEYELSVKEKQAAIIETLAKAGIGAEAAALFAGVEKTEAKSLGRVDVVDAATMAEAGRLNGQLPTNGEMAEAMNG